MQSLNRLTYDPIPFLLSSKNASIIFFTKRDLLGKNLEDKRDLWESQKVLSILRRQKPDGRWLYPGGGNLRIRSKENYDQLETYRQLGVLVEEFGLDNTHPAIRSAAQFLFKHQTQEGDFRGIYGRQYSPNYTAGIMELLIKAGYGEDSGIEQGFHWLLAMRQKDGGWAIPLRTNPGSFRKGWTEVLDAETLDPDRSKPFSHFVTGIVLRAFAAHEKFRKSAEAIAAGKLISARFFKADTYVDRKGSEFWQRVSFPFWFTDVISVVDSLSLLGFRSDDPKIKGALNWLAARQARDGSFRLKLLRTRDKALNHWICLAICRVFTRFDA